MNKVFFTTSWDDGSVLDMKVADLLSRYGMKGTFYIPEKFDGKNEKHSAYDRRLNEDEIRSIARAHEVGAHGITHHRLTVIPPEEARSEIVDSKSFLENITGTPVTMFAYPGGLWNESVAQLTKDAGFAAARTTQKLFIQQDARQFLINATVICQPFPLRKKDADHYYWGRIFDPMRTYTPRQFALSWQSLARKWFKKALAGGNYFHLSGHSWELEKYGMWDELESFLKFVKDHKDVIYICNGDVVNLK